MTRRDLLDRTFRIGILVKGADWAADQVVGREEVESGGGRVISIPLAPGYSTTKLVQRIRNGGSSVPASTHDATTTS